MPTRDDVWNAIDDLPDPEIPMVTLVEMGIVREVIVEEDGVTVIITPTFSGCPALHEMKADIRQRVRQTLDVDEVTVETTFSPPWTTDWITDSAREKLREFGIAPPKRHGGNVELILFEKVACPYCGTTDTITKNDWGPTPCRTIQYCKECGEPFEGFKPL